ncbi:hypothetical protein V1478_002652 [Vespula squamosa]|uniref:Uncharacterized protein n=1 Tax=Vespula squamosa TaxID=30214 RepID=A0ABD2BT61_VESSQ
MTVTRDSRTTNPTFFLADYQADEFVTGEIWITLFLLGGVGSLGLSATRNEGKPQISDANCWKTAAWRNHHQEDGSDLRLVEKATVTDDDEFVEGWKFWDRGTQSRLSIKFVELAERYPIVTISESRS